MKRLARDPIRRRPGGRPGRGFTILELLIATTLTLMLMATVVTIFGAVSRSVRESRAVLEMAGRLRVVKDRLEHDLEGLTVVPAPPRRPDAGEGYLEIVEGPWGVDRTDPTFMMPVNVDTGLPDTTVADFDDVLMFTSRNRKVPFVGRYRNKRLGIDTTIQSEEAEVMWFVRSNTLYRRVLLVAPQWMRPADGNWDVDPSYVDNNYSGDMVNNPIDDASDDNGVIDRADLTDADGNFHAFHEWYDLSARPELDPTGSAPPWNPPTNAVRWGWKLNTLGDLTKRENRFAHRLTAVDSSPWSIRRWGQLRLPTLCECSHPWWMTWVNATPNTSDLEDPAYLPAVTPQLNVDLWAEPHPWPEVHRELGTLQYSDGRYLGPRIAEDVMLTNVIGFDVKVWDPGARLFYAVNDRGTPLDLSDDTSVTSVVVKPGDPGYALAFAHRVYYESSGAPASPGVTPSVVATGAYVDMGYAEFPLATYFPTADAPTLAIGRGMSSFSGPGDLRSQLVSWVDANGDGVMNPGELVGGRTYDTWSTHYENDGGPGTDGFDNNGNGIVDEPAEWQFTPPYFAPLRGIQVEIRTFDPDSRQVRSVTLVMDFLK